VFRPSPWLPLLLLLLWPAWAPAQPARDRADLRDLITALRQAEVLSVFPRPGEDFAATLRRRGVDADTVAMIAGLLDGDPALDGFGRDDRLVLSLRRAGPGEPPDLLALQIRGTGDRQSYLLRDDDGGYAIYSEESPAAVEIALATGTGKSAWRSLFPLPPPDRGIAALGLAPPAPRRAIPSQLTALIRPIGRARLSSGFGWRVHPVLNDTRFHRGVDFAAPTGTPVFAAADGVVDTVDWRGNYGRYVKLRHARGMTTGYAHLAGFAMGLGPGRAVRQGQIIGYVGASGLATGPHLYFEVRIDEKAVDPGLLLTLG
jgi:murein DD-endopeptidase MepM/ murein hydrolase activator NlpD